MNMQKLFQQAQKVQAEMARVQEELGSKTVEATAGGQAVKAVANGHQELVALQIDPSAVDPDDVEMLQDLVLTAVNEALHKAKEMAEGELGRVAQKLGLPGVPGAGAPGGAGLAGF
ncbi:MAG: YbaB/EbfC family nucleoid-associated protein [Limnochordaceae bacterium]|nr:YbaB/EbfC family nucleoid-associated protein [Limnochordaceae bacterium]